MSRRLQRATKLAQRLRNLPLSEDAQQAAFEQLRATGELPEDPRLAAAAVRKALRFRTEVRRPCDPVDVATATARLRAAARALEASVAAPPTVSARRQLFEEALDDFEPVRLAARTAIKLLVAAGWDVTDPLGDVEPPDFGSRGLSLLGFPECLARPPYEEQGRRLLDRLAALREQVVDEDESWIVELAQATSRFLRSGALPGNGFLQNAVLVYAEFLALARHLGDDADAEVLAAFDQLAQSPKKGKPGAIKRVQALAAEGRIS